MNGINDFWFVFTLIFIIALFFILRELVCWYWKVNESIELQKDIKNLLEMINNKPVMESQWLCRKCGGINKLDGNHCTQCGNPRQIPTPS